MPRKYLVTDLILQCQQRCEMENDALIDALEWARLVSEAYGELYSIVFETGNEYFEYTASFTTDGTNILAEPSDHLSTVALTYFVSGSTSGARYDLTPCEAQERARLSGLSGAPLYYTMVDDKIYLYPTPSAGALLEMRYVPQPPNLSSGDLSTVLADVVTPDGLTFLIEAVAVKALRKAKRDTSEAIGERERARDRFLESAILRSITSGHHRIVDRRGGLLDGFEDGCAYRDSADWWPR